MIDLKAVWDHKYEDVIVFIGCGLFVALVCWLAKKAFNRHSSAKPSGQVSGAINASPTITQHFNPTFTNTITVPAAPAPIDEAANAKRDVDRKIVADLRNIMSAEGTIDFLRSEYFYRFDPDRLKPLCKVVRDHDEVDHEFIEAEMEAIRKLFLNNSKEFLRLVGAYTFPDPDSPDRGQTVARGQFEDYSDDPEDEARIKLRMDEMQAAADNVCSTTSN